MSNEIALIEKENAVKLETNIGELELFVAEKLKEYTPGNYLGDSDAAKKDRATLNSSSKAISATRIEIVKRAMERFGISEMETRCKKLEKNIATASAALDAIVKEKEEEEKRVKRSRIEEFWACQNFDLVPLEKVFDQKWLNKTAKDKDIFADIESKIETIYRDIKTLESMSDADVLKQLYLDTLDLGSAIRKGEELKAYREKLAIEERERADREARKALQTQQVELAHEEIKSQKNAPIEALAAQVLGEKVDDDPMMEYTLRFKAKKSVLFALRQYMTDNGILYEKL